MKRIGLAVFLLLLVASCTSTGNSTSSNEVVAEEAKIPSPPTDGYVLDTLDWFNSSQLSESKNLLAKINSETTVEIAVVTLNNCGEDSTAFRNELFRNWGIGKKDKDNGLLILICWYNGDKNKRKVEQEVGYGLEGVITDVLTARIRDKYFVPVFKQSKSDEAIVSDGDAAAGLIAMIKAYEATLKGEKEIEVVNEEEQNEENWPWWVIVLIIIFVVAVIAIAVSNDIDGNSSSSGSSWSGGSDGGGGFDGGFGGGDSGGGGSSGGF